MTLQELQAACPSQFSPFPLAEIHCFDFQRIRDGGPHNIAQTICVLQSDQHELGRGRREALQRPGAQQEAPDVRCVFNMHFDSFLHLHFSLKPPRSRITSANILNLVPASPLLQCRSRPRLKTKETETRTSRASPYWRHPPRGAERARRLAKRPKARRKQVWNCERLGRGGRREGLTELLIL
jgi:hypothetical protein